MSRFAPDLLPANASPSAFQEKGFPLEISLQEMNGLSGFVAIRLPY